MSLRRLACEIADNERRVQTGSYCRPAWTIRPIGKFNSRFAIVHALEHVYTPIPQCCGDDFVLVLYYRPAAEAAPCCRPRVRKSANDMADSRLNANGMLMAVR